MRCIITTHLTPNNVLTIAGAVRSEAEECRGTAETASV